MFCVVPSYWFWFFVVYLVMAFIFILAALAPLVLAVIKMFIDIAFYLPILAGGAS